MRDAFSAEMLSATEILKYGDSAEKLDALRATLKAAGIKRIARMSGVQRSKVQAFVNQGTKPHPPTIARIEAALKKLRRWEADRS
jgi:DNA-binding phage protein